MKTSRRVAASMFARDLAECIRLADARKAKNAAARESAMTNPELHADLMAEAARRGYAEIDWRSYFSNLGIL